MDSLAMSAGRPSGLPVPASAGTSGCVRSSQGARTWSLKPPGVAKHTSLHTAPAHNHTHNQCFMCMTLWSTSQPVSHGVMTGSAAQAASAPTCKQQAGLAAATVFVRACLATSVSNGWSMGCMQCPARYGLALTRVSRASPPHCCCLLPGVACQCSVSPLESQHHAHAPDAQLLLGRSGQHWACSGTQPHAACNTGHNRK